MFSLVVVLRDLNKPIVYEGEIRSIAPFLSYLGACQGQRQGRTFLACCRILKDTFMSNDVRARSLPFIFLLKSCCININGVYLSGT